jgi:hypothetical protein
MRSRLFIVFLVFLVSACAPNKQFVQTAPNNDTKMSNLKSIAIVADVCLMRDVMTGDKYWSIKDSRLAAQHMVERTKKYLTDMGYDVPFAEAASVGGFMNAAGSIKFAVEEGGQIGEMLPPLFVSEGLTNDPVYGQSLTKMFASTMNAVGQKDKPPSDVCCSSADIKDALSIVSRKTGGNAILFLVGNGVIVSTGRSIAEGIATGVITTVLTLGMFTYTQWSVSWLDTYAALVDADSGAILWSKSIRLSGGGFTEKDYYPRWSSNIMYDIMPISSNRYVGCFEDRGNPWGTSGRDLSDYSERDGDMTIDKCVSICKDKGYKYAGAQYSKWCFCGNKYGSNGISNNCHMSCAGNNDQICGGSYANSIYRTNPDEVEDIVGKKDK